MLLDEDPATLIHETTLNFNTQPDEASLARISTSLSTLSDSRSLRLSGRAQALKRAQRQLATLQAQHNLTLHAHNPAEHASSILALDTQKFRIAKEASDLEIEAERLDAELGSAEDSLREVEAQGVAGGRADGKENLGVGGSKAAEEEMQLLKLKLYQSLGVDVQGDVKNGAGWRSALVRNATDGTARMVELGDGNARSRAAGADAVWNAL